MNKRKLLRVAWYLLGLFQIVLHLIRKAPNLKAQLLSGVFSPLPD